MPSKTERAITAATAVALAAVVTGGIIGPIVGAAAVDYAAQKLAKRAEKKKPG